MLFDVFRWSLTYGIRLVSTDLDNCVEDDIGHGFSRCPRLTSTDSVHVDSTVMHRDQSDEQSDPVEFYCFFLEFYVFHLVNCFILIYISMF